MRHRVQGAASLALLLHIAGCSGTPDVTTPTAPSSGALNVSGRWSAVLTGLDAAAANGELAVTLDHRPIDAERGLLLGAWTLTSPDQSLTRVGTVSGVVMGAVGMIDLVPVPRLECQNAFDALLAGVLSLQVTIGGDQLAGTVGAHTCGARSDSIIELRR